MFDDKQSWVLTGKIKGNYDRNVNTEKIKNKREMWSMFVLFLNIDVAILFIYTTVILQFHKDHEHGAFMYSSTRQISLFINV